MFASVDGGDQLRLVHSPLRRLITATFAADDEDDLARTQRALHRLGIASDHTGSRLRTADPATATSIELTVKPRLNVPPTRPRR